MIKGNIKCAYQDNSCIEILVDEYNCSTKGLNKFACLNAKDICMWVEETCVQLSKE